MSRSPKDCSGELFELVREALWRHWAALGVTSHGPAEERFVLDVEALLVTTFSFGLRDERLLRSSFEWLSVHGGLVSRARLLRIGTALAGAGKVHRINVFTPELSARVNAAMEALGNKPLGFLGEATRTEPVAQPERRFPEAGGAPRRIRPLGGQWPAAGQLILRELFGVNARAETLLYLLILGKGSSLGIARSMGYDQKSVYRILESWIRAGMVRKSGRSGGYRLAHAERWRDLLDVRDDLRLPDWSTVFRVVALAVHGLGAPPRDGDPYLAASLLRDLLPEVEEVGRLLGLTPPDLAGAVGAEAFEPVVDAVLAAGSVLAGAR